MSIQSVSIVAYTKIDVSRKHVVVIAFVFISSFQVLVVCHYHFTVHVIFNTITFLYLILWRALFIKRLHNVAKQSVNETSLSDHSVRHSQNEFSTLWGFFLHIQFTDLQASERETSSNLCFELLYSWI